MTRIISLIEQGEQIRNSLNDENLNQIYKWLSESQLYVETKYPKLEFTKSFNSDVDNFKSQASHYDIIDESNFDRILSSLKGVKAHEESNNKDWKEAFEQMK
ncbi:hypothetical protein [Robertmurraya sp. Marseille-Q9965]